MSRLATWLFAAALVVTLAELGWWTWFNLRNTARERRDHLSRIEAQVRLADGLQRVLSQDGLQLGLQPDAAADRAHSLLVHHFPELSFAQGEYSAAKVGTALGIEQRFIGHVRMFVAEGAVFALLLLLGGYLVVRSLQHELAIVRQTSNFVAAITHELNSPLASLRLWVETLERHPPAAEELASPLQIMRADIDRLATLIGNVLTAARLEGGGDRGAAVSQQLAALDVVACSSAIVESLAARAQRGGIALTLHVQGEKALRTPMAPSAFELILRNLLDNAIKYSGQGKRVDVRLVGRTDTLELVVTDYGIGLARAELGRIFRKFYRVGDEMVRQSQGTGLGLFLVRAVVREHGGQIAASSEGLGRGATFRVTLPRAPGPGGEAEGPKRPGEVVG